jgi:hypothetical protein
MMTDKEKNWVVNVQMLQLQIADPYCLDFYYTAWMLKKKQFSLQNSNSSGLKTTVLFQSNNKKDERNYRPCENQKQQQIIMMNYLFFIFEMI